MCPGNRTVVNKEDDKNHQLVPSHKGNQINTSGIAKDHAVGWVWRLVRWRVL